MNIALLKLFLISFIFLFLGCEEEKTFSQSKNLEEWLAKPLEQREDLSKIDFATKALSSDEAKSAKNLLWQDYSNRLKLESKEEWEKRELKIGTLTMPFFYETFGAKPSDGRSLFISLHGGGGVPAAANDRQYENQKRLYNKTMEKMEGVYLAPRAPTNTWDLWHQGHVDSFLEKLIQLAVINLDVNPNKVYLMGYSAGGDGVYQLAPRMAQRWAAAAMMAGHPNDASPLSLRNTPFAIHMGAEDGAFDRNLKAQEWGGLLEILNKAEPTVYQHEVVLHEGKGHWMELQDAVALPWMQQYIRNPYPAKVVWRQDDVHHEHFYWLEVGKTKIETGGEIVVSYDKGRNEIDISENYNELLIIHLNDKMLNLDQPVTIKFQGKEIVKKVFPRTISNLYRSMSYKGDIDYTFSAKVEVVNKSMAY